MKEASIKICVGREGMKNEEIAANINAAYSSIVNALPTKKENVKSVLVKLTMSKPLKVEMK
jgi:ribosomal protein L1